VSGKGIHANLAPQNVRGKGTHANLALQREQNLLRPRRCSWVTLKVNLFFTRITSSIHEDHGKDQDLGHYLAFHKINNF